jgi:imidazolonepropionase-like amidohydrolase
MRTITNLVAGAFLGGAITLGVASTALAQDLTSKAGPQTRPVLIEGATIHTVSNGVIENGAVLFDDGLIETVLDAAALADWRRANPNADIEVIDGRGRHVYPGLISAASDMGLNEIGSVQDTVDSRETGTFTPEVQANTAVNPDSTHIPVARSNGVLLVGVWPGGGTISGRGSVMRMDGWTWEDMTVRADAGLYISWPNMRVVDSPFVRVSAEDQKKRTDAVLASIDGLFDEAEAYFAAREADPSMDIDIRLEGLRSAIEGRSPVVLDANETEQIQAAVSWAVRRGLRPIVYGGRHADKVASLLLKHSVPVIVQGTHGLPGRRDAFYDEVYTLPARLHEAGLTVCIGNPGGSSSERNLPYQAGTAVAYGLPHDVAIRAITLTAAEVLGVADQYGSIQSGKSATLILTDGDPLEITTNVHEAFIDGRRVNLTNKQRELRDKYLEKYRQLGEIE